MVIFAFVGASALSAFLWFNRDKIFPSELDEASILQNIFKNNPQTLLSSSLTKSAGGRNTFALDSAESVAAEDQALGMPAPEDLQETKSYNYNYTKTTTVPGPKASICSALYVSDKTESYENYDYFDDENYYYKSISRNSGDSIMSYYLELGDETYQYQGGLYAVKILRNMNYGILKSDVSVEIDATTVDETSPNVSTETILPTEEEPMLIEEDESGIKETPETDIAEVDSSYFGEDTSVEEVTENGVKYYVATWSYETSCDLSYDWKAVTSSSRDAVTVMTPENETSEDLRKVYVRSWSRADDYQIVKQEAYIDSVVAANLVSTTTTETDSRDVVFSQVADQFVFDLGVPVREVDMRTDYVDPYSDMAGYLSYTSNFIATNGIKTLAVGDSNYAMTSGYFNSEYGKQDEWYGYIIDREYYASTAEGQDLYDQAVENYWMKPGSSSLGSIDYANEDYSKSLYIAIFEGSISDDDIWNNYVYRGSDMESVNKTVLVDGEEMTVTGYYWDYDTSTSSVTEDAPDTATSGSSSGSAGSGEDSAPAEIIMDERPYISAQLYVLISKNGFKYLINYYGSDETSEAAVLPGFVTRDLTIESVRNEFLGEIEATYEANRGIPEPAVDVMKETVEIAE